MSLRTHPIDTANGLTGMNGKVKTTVDYVLANKRTKPAVILGAGTASGLKLQLDGKTVVDNVAPATTYAQTGVYRYNSIA